MPIANPTQGFLVRYKNAEVTAEDIEAAKWILGNCVHYFHGRSNEAEDTNTVAKALASERLRLKA